MELLPLLVTKFAMSTSKSNLALLRCKMRSLLGSRGTLLEYEWFDHFAPYETMSWVDMF